MLIFDSEENIQQIQGHSHSREFARSHAKN